MTALVALGPTLSAHADDASPAQWYLGPMKADEMWQVSTGKGIKVAVIGSGVNPSTPSLKGQVLEGIDALAADGLSEGSVTDTRDKTGEGTTVAELIAGTGRDGGIKGLAPGVKIIPIRVPPLKHDDLPDPNYPLATAIKAAVDQGADIINITIGSQYPIGTQFVGDTVLDYAVDKGVLMIAAVGDSADEGNEPQYPAAYRQVAGVGAMDKQPKVLSTSQHGQDTDLVAPGADIPRWCDASFQRYCADGRGTVPASALVSASAALVWSEHPEWTAGQVWRVLLETASRQWATNSPTENAGYGTVRPRMNLLTGAGDPGPAQPGMNAKDVDNALSRPSPTTSATDEPAPELGHSTPAAARTAPTKDNDTSPLYIAVGAAAGAVVLAAGCVWAVKRRRQHS